MNSCHAFLQEEWRMPLQQGEGPVGLVVCPSRELARQTFNIVTAHAAALAADGWPELRSLLCVGGEDMRGAADALRRGIHAAVCTPGRLKDFLAKRRITLDVCRYLCLDEADRMVCAKLVLCMLCSASHAVLGYCAYHHAVLPAVHAVPHRPCVDPDQSAGCRCQC